MAIRAKAAARQARMTGSSRAKASSLVPPKTRAPQPSPPISTTRRDDVFAPWPTNDRFPTVVGQSISLTYLASSFRLALTGYRQQFVDVLNELLENDPHLYAVVQKRILSVANGRLEIVDADLPEDHPDYELARDVGDMVRREIARIPDLTKALGELLWAVYYGISAAEIVWARDADGWHVDRLGFIHNRRISYPDYQSWDVYIWDQGQVYGWQTAFSAPTNNGLFGLRVADWPGKFIVHTPQLRGDYPTRDGIGRQVAVWALMKRIGGRGASTYLERFAKGFMDVEYSTSETGKPREATDADIAEAISIAAKIGPGSGSYAVHADSIKLNPKSFDGSGVAKLTWSEWISVCNSEMSKAALGGTLTTDHGGSGGLGGSGTAEAQERGELDLEQYDATTVGESLRRDLVSWLVRLNKPNAMHLVPSVKLHVDAEPDPKAVLEQALTLTKAGAPVDADELADRVGIRLVPNESGKPRRLFVSDTLDPSQVDPELLSEEAKKQKEDSLKAKQDLELAKAKYEADVGVAKSKEDDAQAAAQTKPGDKSPEQEPAAPKTDDEADDKALSDAMRTVLMTARDDRAPAVQVFDQLLDDYPAKALGWVLAGHWQGPVMVPLDQIDFSSRNDWRASHDGTIPEYVEKVSEGRLKPVIMVKTPGNPKLLIVDGHHRTLASEQLDRPVLAYVATVHTDRGPWLELHGLQRKGSSGGPSYASYSSYFTRQAPGPVAQPNS